MKLDADALPLDRALFGHHERLQQIEAQLYGHVFDAVDCDKLFGLEQVLWMLLDDLDLPEALQLDLTHLMIARALARVGEDPRRGFSTVPYGITKEEEAAVAFDEDCLFCKAEASMRQAETREHDHDEEPCPLCDDLAQQWREEHAEALGRIRGDRSS